MKGVQICFCVRFALLCAVMAVITGCATRTAVPERVFNIGDMVIVISGELSGIPGKITEADRSHTTYTVDFGDRTNARRMYWNQLQLVSRRPSTFSEGDTLVVTDGALHGKVGRVVTVYSHLDEYVLQFSDGVQAGRFYAEQLKAWTPAAAATAVAAPLKAAFVPFTGMGIDNDHGETFAWHLANIPDIAKKYTIVPLTPNIRRKTNEELYMDYNHVNYSPALDISEKLETDYVFAGYSCKVGDRSVILIVMLEGKTGRLIAGDYQPYLNTQQIPAFFPAMVKKILSSAEKNAGGEKPRLAVRTIAYPAEGIEPADAEVLSNLLAADIANLGSFAVFPRDAVSDSILVTLENEHKSDTEITPDKTTKTKADYVLSGKISFFNTKNQFVAEVVGVANNVRKTGASIDFGTIEDALEKIRRLAEALNSSAAISAGK
jgi:hypothetical protein